MAEVTIQDALEYCLANPDGLGVEELLGKFPQYREELQPLLALSRRVGEVAPPTVPAERRAAMKARLMEAAAAQRQAAPVEAARAAERVVVKERKSGWLGAILRRPALAGAAMAAALVMLVWWGAAAALPNSPFYNIKLASENILLNFAGGVADKATAHLGFASSRLGDIEEMNRQNLLADAGSAVTNFQEHINGGATLWKDTTGDMREAIRASISAAVTRCEQIFKGFGTRVAGLPESARAGIAKMFANLSVIRGDIGESTFMDVPEGITYTIEPQPTPGVIPVPTQVVGTPSIAGSPTGVAAPSVSPGESTSVIGSPTVRVAESETPQVRGTGTQTVGGANVTETATIGQPGVATVEARTATSLPTATPKTVVTTLPTSVIRPTRTVPLSRTGTPVATRTPGIVPTAPRLPTSAVTPPGVPSPVIPPTASPTTGNPQPVPPSNTPEATRIVPPVETILPTKAPPQITPPVPVPPTIAAEPTSLACTLRVGELEIDTSCAAGGDVSWSAQVENDGPDRQEGGWVAVLKVQGRSGPYQEAGRQSGIVIVDGNSSTQVEGNFRSVVPGEAKGVRVELTVTRDGVRCNQMKEMDRDCEDISQEDSDKDE